MKKVIRDGHVAVIYSPGFGAGWYTWNQLLDNAEQLIYDPMIVQILEEQSDNWLDQLVEYVIVSSNMRLLAICTLADPLSTDGLIRVTTEL